MADRNTIVLVRLKRVFGRLQKNDLLWVLEEY